MSSKTLARIPLHLHRYIVEQNYARYTPEDQASWRFIMRQLKNFLTKHAHKSYLDGLAQSGLEVDHIPRIEHIDAHLAKFGWGAVPVSGFIPPAAFMEFQSLGILPIASDMRTLEHLLYTPAPDIVHEAAGHAPILAQPEYAEYLRQYGEVARHSIISFEDMAQYEAIRLLSDIKEDPNSTPEQVTNAEKNLTDINAKMPYISEAALLSRMNWWTAEYGLIGDLDNPKIFGAGLLSSFGEARLCLDDKVKKIPLSVKCVDYSYDITEPQPQLFVTEDFRQLSDVLEDLADTLAYRRGGAFGLDRAIEAKTVNTVQLDSGLQISGILQGYLTQNNGEPIYLQFTGPSQLSLDYHELPGQGCTQHAHGFSSPLGPVKGFSKGLHELNSHQLASLKLIDGASAKLEFTSGIVVSGDVKGWTTIRGTSVILTWINCTVKFGDKVLFEPAWGDYDMAIGHQVTSVFGGAADRTRYGETTDFVAKVIPPRVFSESEDQSHKMFQSIRDLRSLAKTSSDSAREAYGPLHKQFTSSPFGKWLHGIELLEIAYELNLDESVHKELKKILDPLKYDNLETRECIQFGLQLASTQL